MYPAFAGSAVSGRNAIVWCDNHTRGAELWGFCWDAQKAGQPPRRDARACPAAHIVDSAVAMPEETAESAEPVVCCLADKVNWLIDRARPAGRGSWSNAEVAELIERTTGERVSYTTIWKLRNGQAANPQMKLIEAMARTFGVPAGFFFADYDTGQAGLLQEEVALRALVRSARSSAAELRVFLGWSPEARQAVIDLMTALTAAR
jgi:transcriptional regulator with XRE-family HTH domain